LIITEDFTFDQHILRPLAQAMFRHLQKPRAKVDICYQPRLGGVDRATDWQEIKLILDRYGMIDLFLLCVDRDGNENRRQVLDNLEERANHFLGGNRIFLAENAWQEVEVWALAGHELPGDWNWQEIREDDHPKERYFLPWAEQRGLADDLEKTYRVLGQEAAGRYGRIRQLCPELAQLESRINAWLVQNP
jgi:hypothetical protein